MQQNNKKGFAPILIVLIITALVGGYFVYQKVTNVTPDKSIDKLKMLCARKDHTAVALQSIRKVDNHYELLVNGDLNMGTNTTYLESAATLCSRITSITYSDWAVEKTKKSKDKWNYRYISLNGNKFVYEIVYFQNDWRFVLQNIAFLL